MNIENELDPILPEPKSVAEIMADKNNEIAGYQSQIIHLESQLGEIKTALVESKLTAAKYLAISTAAQENQKNMQIQLNCAHDAYDSLIDKLIEKI